MNQKNRQEKNEEVPLVEEIVPYPSPPSPPPSPPPPSPPPSPLMSPLNTPRQRRIFLILVMRHTRVIPYYFRIDRVREIMCQIFSYLDLYQEGGAFNGLYCGYCLNFEEGDFHF